jgi:DNA-binding response OmpR family regulator
MNDAKKILIVDDDQDVVKWLSIFFQENGYDISTANNGAEGIAKAENIHPDLIILDISMPVESGVKMYRKLHDSKDVSDIPVIMLTGIPHDFKRFISTRKQVNPPAAYFDKPVEKQDLLNKVKELIG